MNKIKWNKDIAISIALDEGIILNSIHWKIIYYVRWFYLRYETIPNVNSLLTFMNKKYKIYLDGVFLFKLFPGGYFKQICKITCLPSNVRCF